MPLADGSVLPAFQLPAAVSGRVVSNDIKAPRGILILHGSKTADAAKEVSKAVRAKWPKSTEVFLASITDLRPFAGLWKKVAEAQLKSNYDKMAAKAKDAGMNPVEQVLICPDWDGKVCALLGNTEPDKEASVVVLKNGKVAATVAGKEMAAKVLELLS